MQSLDKGYLKDANSAIVLLKTDRGMSKQNTNHSIVSLVPCFSLVSTFPVGNGLPG